MVGHGVLYFARRHYGLSVSKYVRRMDYSLKAPLEETLYTVLNLMVGRAIGRKTLETNTH